MISKFLSPGEKLELQMLEHARQDNDDNKRIYYSQINDILSEDRLEIVMPMEKSKLILLPVDTEYDMTIYTSQGLFQCFVRVVDRYKSENMYLLVVELTSNLRKNQRREYYRFSCALEMCSRNLEEEEIQAVEDKMPYSLVPGLPLKRSVIADISGGGLRFLSNQKYEPDSLLYCSYHLVINNVRKLYEVIGKVLYVREMENRPGVYEHRVKYINMEEEKREEIIKFIFQEERKNMKRDRFY